VNDYGFELDMTRAKCKDITDGDAKLSSRQSVRSEFRSQNSGANMTSPKMILRFKCCPVESKYLR
jgi:hypothetical protein